MLLAVTRAGRMVEMARKKVEDWLINVSGFSL